KVSAYIGVAQVVSWLKAQHAQHDFVSAIAASRKDEATLTRLRRLGPPPYETFAHQMTMEGLVDRYGAVFHQKPCKMCLTIRGMITGLVTLWEFISIHRGSHASLSAMTPELLSLSLEDAVPRVDVPVFFFLGRHDRHVDSRIAAGYFGVLRAPVKRLIWFENSAHNVPFEESGLFNASVMT